MEICKNAVSGLIKPMQKLINEQDSEQ